MTRRASAAFADSDDALVNDDAPPTLRVFAFRLPVEAVPPELRVTARIARFDAAACPPVPPAPICDSGVFPAATRLDPIVLDPIVLAPIVLDRIVEPTNPAGHTERVAVASVWCLGVVLFGLLFTLGSLS
jgi:hypothetical protein